MSFSYRIHGHKRVLVVAKHGIRQLHNHWRELPALPRLYKQFKCEIIIPPLIPTPTCAAVIIFTSFAPSPMASVVAFVLIQS